MISTNFDYKKAQSVDEALAALTGDAKLLAGGHSLLPAMKLRLYTADTLVDISKIESLKKIELSGDVLSIGAGATHQSIASSDLVKEHAGLFSMVAGKIGDIQVRNMGTIGGSIAHADPAADWPAALLACDATVVIQSSSGTREVAASDFFTGMYSTALGEQEVITAINVASKAGYYCRYEKFVQPASRFALVGCAVCMKLNGNQVDHATVAYTGVSDSPYVDKSASSALKGQVLSNNTIEATVSSRDDSVYVMSDHFASETYRKHLAGVMLDRALSAALS